jgi:membrane-associated protease RseP (regulator of RpoE activity)
MSDDGAKQDAVEEPVLSIVDEYVPVELVDETPPPPPPPARRPAWPHWPLFLFVATCCSTFVAGLYDFQSFTGAVQFSLAVMTILVCHEAGHFVQAMRYGVPASLPFFIPMPLPPIGTMGAVIAMSARTPNRRALFDIGISGPLAGLVPTLIFSYWGMHVPAYDASIRLFAHDDVPGQTLGWPLLLQMLAHWIKGLPFGTMPTFVHPFLLAAWVGLLITSLNLFPIGQLDGGHVLYAILKRKAHAVAIAVLAGAIAAVIMCHHYRSWSLMLALLMFMGPRHPPTSDDESPLGYPRVILGWLTLAFLVLGFCPNPLPQ